MVGKVGRIMVFTYLTYFTYSTYLTFRVFSFLSIDTSPQSVENLFPVPMKHRSETAYLLVLGLIICLSGFLTGLLPKMPYGLPYWIALMALSIVYPILLIPTFRENRADYEFRLLHWFPAGMFLLWGLLQFAAPRSHIGNILMLGFLFLWSLPMVALGISFIILFAVHVMRRSAVRVTVLSILLSLFSIGAVAAEAQGWDRKLQATIFPKDPARIVVSLKGAAMTVKSLVYQPTVTGGPVAVTSSSVSSDTASEHSSSVALISSSGSSSDSRSSLAMQSSAQSSLSSSRPSRLPQSGPEAAGVLMALMLALYSATVHRRSSERA